MRHLSPLFGTGMQVLGCAMLLAATALPAPALAQSDSARTCRSALGEDFSVSSGAHQQRCCLVAEEKPWYDAKGVVLGKVYLTADNRKVRPRLCSSDVDAGAAKGPAETPHSMMTPGDGSPRRTFTDVYY